MEQLENTNDQIACSKIQSISINQSFLKSVLFSALFILGTSCSSPKISGGSYDQFFLDAQAQFIVFFPSVFCKDMQSETLINIPEFNSEATEIHLKKLAENAIHEKGWHIIKIPDDELDSTLTKEVTQGVFRDAFSNNTYKFLERVEKKYGHILVIFITADVLLGPVEDINVRSGEVTLTRKNRTIIKAKIIDAQTKTIPWRNSIQIREEMPNPENRSLEKATKLIFSTLNVRKENL